MPDGIKADAKLGFGIGIGLFIFGLVLALLSALVGKGIRR